jgi:hypothetical protein
VKGKDGNGVRKFRVPSSEFRGYKPGTKVTDGTGNMGDSFPAAWEAEEVSDAVEGNCTCERANQVDPGSGIGGVQLQ